MKARRAVVVVSAAQHSRVHRCWHLLIQTLHCGWRVLHCGRRVLHCGRRRSIEIGMLVHKDLHCWSVLRIFTNQGTNIFVNIKIFLRNLRKYLIIYPLDKNPWFGPLCKVGVLPILIQHPVLRSVWSGLGIDSVFAAPHPPGPHQLICKLANIQFTSLSTDCWLMAHWCQTWKLILIQTTISNIIIKLSS